MDISKALWPGLIRFDPAIPAASRRAHRPIAVVFDLVNPAGAARRLGGRTKQPLVSAQGAGNSDLLELDGRDLRREPIEDRKAALARLLLGAKPGLQLSEHREPRWAQPCDSASAPALQAV